MYKKWFFLILGIIMITYIPLRAGEYKLESETISVSPHRISLKGSIGVRFPLISPFPDGSLSMGWMEDNTVHISFLDNTLKRSGIDIILKSYILQGILALPDYTVLALVIPDHEKMNYYSYSNPAYLIKFRKDGKQVFKTFLLGGNNFQKKNDEGLYKTYPFYHPIAFNGSKIALFLEICKQFGGSTGIHCGDRYMLLNPNGQVDKSVDWSWDASHSSAHSMLATSSGEFLTVTSGDSYPFGIQFINRSKQRAYDNPIIWPPENQRTKEVTSKNNLSTGAGTPEGMAEIGGRVFTLISTMPTLPNKYDSNKDILLVGSDKNGQVQFQNWVYKDGSKRLEGFGIVPFQGGGLIGFYESEYDKESPIYLAYTDSSGKISGQTKLDISVDSAAMGRMFRFPNGDAGFALSPDESSFEIFRVKAGGGSENIPDVPEPPNVPDVTPGPPEPPSPDNGGKEASGFMGTWDCGSYGVMNIQKLSQNTYTGSYSYKDGKINGFERNGILNGNWSQSDSSGTFYFKLQSRDAEIKGRWKYRKDKKWRTSPWNCKRQ